MKNPNPKYLDSHGIAYLWQRMIQYVSGNYYNKEEVDEMVIPIDDIDQIREGAQKGMTAVQVEVDPTVPSWAKNPFKPSYTASEVGAVPVSRTINNKSLNNDITLSASDVHALPDTTPIPPAQIQSDWNQTDTAAKDYIKNKPTTFDQKQADWNETDTTDPAYIKNKPDVYSKPSGGIPSTDMSSAVQTSLGKADTALQSETDPTVPSWAKASSKPSYTASEVGAVPTTRTVNGKALSSDVTLSASDVGALPSSTTIPTITFRQW